MAKLTDDIPAKQQAELRPGESRTFIARNKAGEVLKEYTINRTDRPYAYDLADAYNASMSPLDRERGLLWQVSRSGELFLDYAPQASAAFAREGRDERERDRREWVRNSSLANRDFAPPEAY